MQKYTWKSLSGIMHIFRMLHTSFSGTENASQLFRGCLKKDLRMGQMEIWWGVSVDQMVFSHGVRFNSKSYACTGRLGQYVQSV